MALYQPLGVPKLADIKIEIHSEYPPQRISLMHDPEIGPYANTSTAVGPRPLIWIMHNAVSISIKKVLERIVAPLLSTTVEHNKKQRGLHML